MSDKREFLRCFPRAAQLEAEALKELFEGLSVVRFEPQKILFAAGDAPDAAYMVSRGSLLVLHSGLVGDIPLARIYRGDMIGEMGLLDGSRRSASAVVEEPLVAWRLSRARYAEFRTQGHPAAAWFLDELGHRLTGRVRSTEDRIGRIRQDPSLAAIVPEASARRGWWSRLSFWPWS